MWIILAALIVVGIVVVVILLKKKNNGEEQTIPVVITSNEDPTIPVVVPPNRPATKRALLVGINKYRPDLNANLEGCVNDVENTRDILVNTFGFNPDNIRVLTDERATKSAILERLNWLILEAVPGDTLVFHYSGHGSQVRCREGDELDDGLDEILCPYDLDWDDPLTDDTIGQVFSKSPVGAALIMLCDACHSGTMTKELTSCNPSNVRAKFILPPFDIRARTLGRWELPKNTIREVIKGSQRHILLSGCKDNQTSADATIDGKPQGALTWAVTSVIRSNPNITWTELHAAVLKKLFGAFTQEPQLSGDADLIDDKIFGGK